MVDLRPFADRILHYHRSMLKLRGGCMDPARRYSSPGAVASGGFQLVRQFRGIEPPSSLRSSLLLLGGGSRSGLFEKALRPFFTSSMRRRFSSTPVVAAAAPRPTLSISSPWLMVPPGVVVENTKKKKKKKSTDDYYNFFSIQNQKEFRIKKPITKGWQRELLTPNDALCIGSSHGWLVFMDPQNCYTYLLNPFLNSENNNLTFYIPLPPLETLPNIRGVRVRKMDQRSPSPSLINEFIVYSKEEDLETDLHSEELSSEYRPIRRLAMSSPPSFSHKLNCCYSDSCTVMVIEGIYREDVAFCRLGDEKWTGLVDKSVPDSAREGDPYVDLAYFSKDQLFYALDDMFCIEAWDLNDPSSPKRIRVIEERPPYPLNPNLPEKVQSMLRWLELSPEDEHVRRRTYLVESSGDLLMVIRYIDRDASEDVSLDRHAGYNSEDEYMTPKKLYCAEQRTLRCDVFKLDLTQKSWEFVECLGDRALFVGSNHSFSLSTCDCPGLRGNSIYFTDDDYLEGSLLYKCHDNGVFDMGLDCVTPYYPRAFKRIDQQPIWVAPNAL